MSIVEEYLALTEATEADLVAMQVGDFYEFFADGARTVADELDLKVSEKSSHGASYPMAGVPVSELTPYLRALVERGYRVAVADQHEEDGDIERTVTRVVTPGTLLETTDAAARYLVALVATDDGVGVAAADVTTGRFRATTCADADAALAECHRFDPAEVLLGPSLREDGAVRERVTTETDAAVTDHDQAAFAPGRAAHAVREQFGGGTAESLGLADAAVRAAGAVLDYVTSTGVGVSESLTRLGAYHPDDHVTLDATTQRNLELVTSMTDGGTALLDVVDHTVTSAGGRRLREWLVRPRRDRAVLTRRQASVAALVGATLAREGVREELDGAADLERLVARATSGSADAADLRRAADTLARLPALREVVDRTERLRESPLPDVLGTADDRVDRLRAELDAALVADPPAVASGTGIVARGYDEDLDDVVADHEAALEWIEGLAAREGERLGVTHLQVDRNTTDGYYIQVGNSETDAVPDDYREIKTLKNSKRYTTDELDDRERDLLRLEERRTELETAVVDDLRARLAAAADAVQAAGRALADVDALSSLAVHAAGNDWTRPELTAGDELDVEAGRHPVVEQTTEFVPNDARLDGDRRVLLVTGPNMSGKSTYMRQVALVVLLAQTGSFVPADAATVGLVDGIYTRVGALDELAGGRSTFMVEMQELSRILHAATEDSLVVLDEVGRGTATYDGLSIAWAATEYIATRVRAKTLFATHYHELTRVEDHFDAVHNVHVAAEERDGDVTFVRTVRDGSADRSYGIHVAELAGVPDPVVGRAREVLRNLREDEAIDVRGSGGETRQVVFDLESGQVREEASADGGGVDPDAEAVLAELRDVDLTGVTPIELLSRVEAWQDRLDESAE
ncbi:MAG: DNA mismatch repair protein MutS [Halobacteriaceae archaeon]